MHTVATFSRDAMLEAIFRWVGGKSQRNACDRCRLARRKLSHSDDEKRRMEFDAEGVREQRHQLIPCVLIRRFAKPTVGHYREREVYVPGVENGLVETRVRVAELDIEFTVYGFALVINLSR